MPHELSRMATSPRINPLASYVGALIAAILLFTVPAYAERVLVSNEKDNTITGLDARRLAVIATVPVGARPRGIVPSRDGKSLYICTSDADHIEVLDLVSLKVTRTLPSG